MKGNKPMTKKEALCILKPESNTSEALKKAYRQKAFKFHPDYGGDPEIMKLVNNAYELLLKCQWTSEEKETASNDVPLTETLKKKWDTIASWPGIQGEVIGSWLWVSGNTKPYKDHLKAQGFKWSPKKFSWYWYQGKYRKRGKKVHSMDEIRTMFGKQDLNNRKARGLA